MNNLKNISIALLVLIFTIPVYAQETNNRPLNITTGELNSNGDSMYVHMIVDLSKLSLDKNRSLTLTPIITGNANQQKALPEILINGTTRHKSYLRSLALSNQGSDPYHSVVKLDKNAPKELHYRWAVPYEKWMNSSHLDVKEDFCGCGGYNQEEATNRIYTYTYVEKTPYEIKPQLAYIQPDLETTKTRGEQWETFLDFPVNKYEISADYMNNPSELSKIESALKTTISDNNITVTSIDIIGFASPEGSITHNENLSKQRAERFKSYLVSKVNFPANIYHVQYGGENWEGLEDAIVKSNITEKDDILSVIQNTGDVNLRKNKIKALNNGNTYKQLLADIYPKLRKVISSVHYNVRGFSVDEAKDILSTRPQQLSLDEMFRIANTYQPGSSQFTEVFETAVRLFPNDKTANLNAAAAALSANNITGAEKYLNKADMNTPQYMNNLGVLYLLKGDLDKAQNQFNKAIQSGSDVARNNLQEVKNKIDNDSSLPANH